MAMESRCHLNCQQYPVSSVMKYKEHSKATFTLQKRRTVRQHQCKEIYGVVFSDSESNRLIFAVCGRENLSIYKCGLKGSIKLLVSYVEKGDSFWTCAWADDTCLAAGYNGIIILVKSTEGTTGRLRGHGRGITELKVKPGQSNLVLSASKDGTVRLWNIRSMTCVAVFADATTAPKQVLSVDFHSNLDIFASVATDNDDFQSTIFIWKLSTGDLTKAIAKSEHHPKRKNPGESFETVTQCKPTFKLEQSDTFGDYVVCIKWHQDYLISYSYERLIWFKIGPTGKLTQSILVPNYPAAHLTGASIVHDFEAVTLANFVTKFDIYSTKNGFILAAGCKDGLTNIWKVNENFKIIENALIIDRRSARTRQCTFSHDGTVLITIHDDGHIRRFDLKQNLDFE